jgi:chromosome partitioning protein
LFHVKHLTCADASCRKTAPKAKTGNRTEEFMARILAIANQKGGVGKTTTAVNLAASLAVAEHRTLLIDLDPQGNATSAFGIDKADTARPHVYHALVDGTPLAQTLRDTELPHLVVCPSNTDLAGAEVELVPVVAREQRLSQSLAPHQGDFEFIIIDCPPSLGLLTLNALTVADAVIVPLQCEFYAMEGMGHLMSTIELVRTHLNPRIQLDGIVLTMYDKRNKLSLQVESETTAYFGRQVFDTRIPRNVRLSESPSFGKPAVLYDVTAPGTKAYLDLASELISRLQKPTPSLAGAA